MFHKKFCKHLLLECVIATLCRSPATEAVSLLSTVWNMSDIRGPCLHIHRLVWGIFLFQDVLDTFFISPEVKHEMLIHGTSIQCIF